MLRLLSLLTLIVTTSAEGNTVVHKALVNFVDAVFTRSELTSSDRERLATVLEECQADATPLTAVLNDAVDAQNACMEAFTDKSDELYLTKADNERFNNCTKFGIRDVFLKHGGLNFLAQPAISMADQQALEHCAAGVGADLATALMVVMNRYTACKLDFEHGDIAILARVLESDTQFVAERRISTLRSICTNLVAFEKVHSLTTHFVSDSVSAFLDGLTDMNK